MNHQCKKCLLLQAGENVTWETVKEYISTLSDELKVDDEVYQNRLDKCMQCDNLISGMCLKCGCYVEVRAVLKDKSCPDYDNIKWYKDI